MKICKDAAKATKKDAFTKCKKDKYPDKLDRIRCHRVANIAFLEAVKGCYTGPCAI